MKAVTISKNGGPEVLELKDIKLGDPKSGEVLIKNEAIGLNYIDTYHRSGLYPVELPSNIGIEGAGELKKLVQMSKTLMLEIKLLTHQCLLVLMQLIEFFQQKN